MSRPSRRTGPTESSRKNYHATTYTHVDGTKIPFASTRRTPEPPGKVSYPDITTYSDRSTPDPIPYPVPDTPRFPSKLWTLEKLSMEHDNSSVEGAIRRNNLRWKNVLRQYANDLREAKKENKILEEEWDKEQREIYKEKKKMLKERKGWRSITRWLTFLLVDVSVLLYYVGTGVLTFYRKDVPDMISWMANTPEEVLLGVGVKPRGGENWEAMAGRKKDVWEDKTRLCGIAQGTGLVKKEYCDLAKESYSRAVDALKDGKIKT